MYIDGMPRRLSIPLAHRYVSREIESEKIEVHFSIKLGIMVLINLVVCTFHFHL